MLREFYFDGWFKLNYTRRKNYENSPEMKENSIPIKIRFIQKKRKLSEDETKFFLAKRKTNKSTSAYGNFFLWKEEFQRIQLTSI